VWRTSCCPRGALHMFSPLAPGRMQPLHNLLLWTPHRALLLYMGISQVKRKGRPTAKP
jgi:hypothetical protein